MSRKNRRAKSVDVDNKHMEEAYASLPASRDSSRTRPNTGGLYLLVSETCFLDGREVSAARSLGGEVTSRRSILVYEVFKGGEFKYFNFEFLKNVIPDTTKSPQRLLVIRKL